MSNVPFEVKITTKGMDPMQWMQQINDKIHFELQEKLVELGELTAFRMGEIVQDSIKRPPNTGRLAMSITSEVLNSVGGVSIGIGNIAKMNSEAPYWELINDGGTYTTKETFVPPPFADGEFRTFKAGSQHTIQPVRYVDIAAEELKKHIQSEIKRLLG